MERGDGGDMMTQERRGPSGKDDLMMTGSIMVRWQLGMVFDISSIISVGKGEVINGLFLLFGMGGWN